MDVKSPDARSALKTDVV